MNDDIKISDEENTNTVEVIDNRIMAVLLTDDKQTKELINAIAEAVVKKIEQKKNECYFGGGR